MRVSPFLVVAALLAGCVAAQTPKPIRTESGDVLGTEKNGIRIFQGVPFAAPPLGPLRWKVPQPPVRSSSPLPANTLGSACVQQLSRSRPPWTEEFMVQNGASEDCLNVNIWAPATGRAHAVLVFLHGGGFAEGSNGISTYEGEALARRGLVVVTANYRLGLLGYFSSTALEQETPTHTAGNYAVADQIAMLQWVKRNIAAFGGDPTRVTLAGQSAGGESVVELMASPSAKGLFQRAIVNSAPPLWPAGKVNALTAAVASGDRWTAAHGNSLEALRSMPAEQVLASRDAPPELRRPVAGDALIPIQPGATVQTGAGADVPVILGWVADDGMLSPTYGKLDAEQFKADAAKRYGDRSQRFLALYPAPDDATAKQSQIAAVRDRNFTIAAIWAEAWRAHHRSPVYLYYFSRVPPWPAHPEFGAHHTAELPYFFGTLDRTTSRAYTAVDKEVSEAAQQAWVKFAETGDPGPPWRAANSLEGPWTVIDQTVTSATKLDRVRLAFWSETLQPKP